LILGEEQKEIKERITQTIAAFQYKGELLVSNDCLDLMIEGESEPLKLNLTIFTPPLGAIG
jgi:hypothetical protein